MHINIENYDLPDIYIRKQRQCYLDTIRNKLIYITPEETIRQKLVSYLITELKVPQEMIAIEVHLSHYGIRSKNRADIVVCRKEEDGLDYPILIIECKSPDVYLDEKTHLQVFDYCNQVEADYAVVVNGYELFCYKYNYEKNQYDEILKLPTYAEMLDGKYEIIDVVNKNERIAFENYEEVLLKKFASYSEDYYGEGISKSTPLPLAKIALNLSEALYDINYKMPEGKYKLFTLIKDYGVRDLSYGNAGGGKFYGPYRSFLIERNESTEFISFGITTSTRTEKPDIVKTCLCVSHDDEKEMHHALQLIFENNIEIKGDEVKFFHHGKIAIGNCGSGKVDELRIFVKEKYPEIILENKFYLGSLKNDHMWNVDEQDVVKLIENIISLFGTFIQKYLYSFTVLTIVVLTI